MRRELLCAKRLLVAVIVLAMLITSTIDILSYAEELTQEQQAIVNSTVTSLHSDVEAVITAEPTAPAGQPFNLNIRLDLPRIPTYTYDASLPPAQTFDRYENVKVTIPLPEGVTTVDPTYLDSSKKNIVIDFKPVGDEDFKGQTNKGKTIRLKVLNNGKVPDGTKFTFNNATWSLEANIYLDKNKNVTHKEDVSGTIATTTHMSTASDTWGIEKKYVKTEEIGDQLVFTFEINVGLAGVDKDKKKILYSTPTEQYDRYGRLNFDSAATGLQGGYKITDTLPQIVQENLDGSSIKTGIYPESVIVTKNAVTAYGIKEEVLYDSAKTSSGYRQGTTKEITFSKYNNFDPNSKTDIIGISPQYTKYTVRLAYDKEKFYIEENEKVIKTFKVTNNAEFDYKLIGQTADQDNDSATASYVIRKGSGQIVLNKYIVYPQDGTEVKELYNSSTASKYPIGSSDNKLVFKIYEDKACTKQAKFLNGDNAEVTYDVAKGCAVFDYINAGTYYIKEIGKIKGFEAVNNPVAVTIPRNGGNATVGFVNKNNDFGSVAVYKVKKTKTPGVYEPFSGVTFNLYKSKADAEANKDVAYTMITNAAGQGYINNVPVATYYAKEDTPYGYEPNNNIYTVDVVADFSKFMGFKAADGQYYGTDSNPIVNERNTGVLYLGVIKWDLDLKNLEEINYLSLSNQVAPKASAYNGYKVQLYYEDASGQIVPYKENGSNVTLTADKNGIIEKVLPEGKYYVVATGYDKDKYTPYAQKHTTVDGKYCMGEFVIERGDDNYNLPKPDKDGNVNWNPSSSSQDMKNQYNVIHNFSGISNMSLKKLGSGQYVVPEARFDVYKISSKGEALSNGTKKWPNVGTNSKAYKFFADVEPGWYAFVETATGPQYYLPTDEKDRRKDIKISKPVFDQEKVGTAGIEYNKEQMIKATEVVYFDNPRYDTVPLVGLTFKKIDSNTKEMLYSGAKFQAYYYKDNDPVKNPNRIYLGVFHYKTDTKGWNRNYKLQKYNGSEYNVFTEHKGSFPTAVTYTSTDKDSFVTAFEGGTTTVVGWIPYNLVGKDIELYIEETQAPIGYKLPSNESDRIKKITVKGGTIDETNVLVLENTPKPPETSITVAVSNRNYNQTRNMTEEERGTYVEGSTVRLYELKDGKWVYVTPKNTTVNGTYITESGATFKTEFGKTYAIAEKKEGNKNNLLFCDVRHKWLLNDSTNKLTEGDGKKAGTYALKEQTTIDGWTLYGPITMPAETTKAENYKFTFYNIPLQPIWFGKVDQYDFDISKSGRFALYKIPSGKNADSPLKELEFVYNFPSKGGWLTYKGRGVAPGKYVIVEVRAPKGYSNPNYRKEITVSTNIGIIPGTNQIGRLTQLKNYEKDYYLNKVVNNMDKVCIDPSSGKISGSLLGNIGEKLNVSYRIDGLSLSKAAGGITYTNVILEDTGLKYYAGASGNGDEITVTEKDYELTDINITKASSNGDDSVKVDVEYRTAGSTVWKTATKNLVLNHGITNVKLGKNNEKAVAFRLKYDDKTVKTGYTGGTITVKAVLNKRDIQKTDQEIISVKNTAKYEFDYSVYDEDDKPETHHSSQEENAIINFNPEDLYPSAQIQKAAQLSGEGDIANAGDIIRYTITLTNTSGDGKNPLKNPMIFDKLPEQVKALANGSSLQYFNITMPSGVKLTTGSGLKEYDGKKYVALFFSGDLEKGQSITVSFDTKVKQDAVSVDKLIRNEAAASSTQRGYVTDENPSAAAYKNASGEWPQQDAAYAALVKSLNKSAYGFIKSKADKNMETQEGLTISKFVQGELDKDTGYSKYLSNTVAGGMVNYKIIVQNSGNAVVKNIRLSDLLPQLGDNVDPVDDRASQWSPTFKDNTPYSIYKVSKNGNKTNLAPTLYTATGSYNTKLAGDASNFKASGSAWTRYAIANNTTAVGFDFGNDVTLQEGEYITIEFRMQAPGGAEAASYAGKFASNHSEAYYDVNNGTVNNLVKSNTVHTIYHIKPVGVGGKVFLDEDIDGLYKNTELTIPNIPVRLYIYEDGKFKEVLTTRTDSIGRYYFDNLMPSYVKDGKFEGHYYQYQVEFDIPQGTCLTDRYTGGADAWKDNKTGEVGTTTAPKTVDDSAYSANGRTNDSNADVKSHKTEIFYLNPYPSGNDSAKLRTEEAGYDLTYDAGLVRVRTIQITKTGGELTAPLAGATFRLTGTGLPKEGIIGTSDSNGLIRFDNPITVDGKTYRINYYGNYKVEEISAPSGYVNQHWVETINAGTDRSNLTYEALNESFGVNYTVNNPKLTDLTIQKTVINGTADDNKREFRFIVNIGGKPYTGEYTHVNANNTQTVKQTDASGYITLKHGEKAVIKNLENGQIYFVREEQTEGFTGSSSGAMGTLLKGTNVNIARFENKKDSGYLRINKVYVGNSIHRQDEFTFNVILNGKAYNGYYQVGSVSKMTTNGKIELKGGETAVIEGGIGQKFEVTEVANSNYKTTVTASKGITTNASKATGELKNEIGEVTYTNELQTTELAITKNLNVHKDVYEYYKNSNFVFKMEVDGKPYVGEYSFYPTKGNPAGKETRYTNDGTFVMSAVNAVSFDKLPKGSTYRVSELENQGGINYIVTKSSFTGTVGKNSDEIVFENKFKETGNLNITKVVKQKDNDTTEFRFRLKLNGEVVQKLSYQRTKTSGTFDTVNVTDGWILLKHGETAVIEGIPKGTTYEVTEEEKERYSTLLPNNYKGTIETATKTVQYTNIYETTKTDNVVVTLRKKVNSDKLSDHTKSYTFFIFRPALSGSSNIVKPLPSGTIVDLTTNKKTKITFSKENKNIISVICEPNLVTGLSYKGDMSMITLKEGEEFRISKNDLDVTGDGAKAYYIFESKADAPNLMQDDISLSQSISTDRGLEHSNLYLSYSHGGKKFNSENHCGVKIYPAVKHNEGITRCTVTNNFSTTEKSYRIQIEKKWKGAIPDAELLKRYPIKIEVKANNQYVPYNGEITVLKDGKSSKVTVKDGLTTIGLKETLTVTETGHNKFRVTELDTEGIYTTSYSGYDNNSTCEITGNETTNTSIRKATITNSYKTTGYLNIRKSKNGGNPDDQFTFKVYINEKPYSGAYNLISPADSQDSKDWTKKETADGTIILKGDQRAKLEGFGPNTSYYVEEIEDSRYVSSCTTNNASGTINDKPVNVRFLNTIKNTGLTISKTAIGGSANDVFYFDVKVKLPGEQEFVPYSGSYAVIAGSTTEADKIINDGVIQLKGGQSAVIRDIPVGTEYKITERTNAKYTLTKSAGGSGKIVETGNTASFTNTHKTGNLQIVKNQVGGSANDSFKFTVTVDGKPYSGNYTLKTGSTEKSSLTTNGVINLKGGQSALIKGLPIDAEYKVKEEDRSDYDEDRLTAIGVIEQNTITETFVNTKLSAVLMFDKQNVGGKQADKFTFNLTVDGTPYNGEYILTNNGSESTLSTSNGKIIISGGQSVKVALPVGSKYELVEESASGYTAVEPTVLVLGDDISEEDVTTDVGKASGTIKPESRTKLGFTNYAIDKASLEISKLRIGGSDRDVFNFTVNIDGRPYSGAYRVFNEEGTELTGPFSTTDGRISLTGGGRILISDLAKDKTFNVTEDANANYISSGLTQNGTLKIGVPAEGGLSVNCAEFINTGITGNFIVTKQNNGGQLTDRFTFIAETKQNVQSGEEDETSDGYAPLVSAEYKLYARDGGGAWSQVFNGDREFFRTDEYGKFTLYGSQKAVFEDIDVGTVIRITEEEADDYRASVSINGGDAVIASQGEITVTAANEDKEADEITFINDYKFSPTEVILKINKTLRGGQLSDDMFDFTIEPAEGENEEEYSRFFLPMTATNKADGIVEFGKMQFDDKDVGKTFKFVLSENKGTDEDIIYSDEKIYAEIRIEKDSEDNVIATVKYTQNDEDTANPTITNIQLMDIDMPETGGTGTTVYSIFAVALLSLAGALLHRRRKKA